MIELLDFYADWCGPCKVMSPLFEELKPIYEGKVIFKKVNVEEETQFAGQYNISGIPTFVILKDGKEVARRSGAMPKEMLKSWIDSNLN